MSPVRLRLLTAWSWGLGLMCCSNATGDVPYKAAGTMFLGDMYIVVIQTVVFLETRVGNVHIILCPAHALHMFIDSVYLPIVRRYFVGAHFKYLGEHNFCLGVYDLGPGQDSCQILL